MNPKETSLSIFEDLIEDDSYDKYLSKFSEKKLAKINRKINTYKTGVYASAPIMCYGPKKCPFLNKCPIPEISESGALIPGPDEDYPVGKECLMEKLIVEHKTIQYVEYLNVDITNPVEMSIVNELALIDLYKNRCLFVLSQGDKKGEGRDFMTTDVIAFNENGDRAESVKLHPVIEMIEKLEKRRERWLERLMETRESKAKLMAKMQENKNQSKMLQEISMLREALYKIESEPINEEILIDDE